MSADLRLLCELLSCLYLSVCFCLLLLYLYELHCIIAALILLCTQTVGMRLFLHIGELFTSILYTNKCTLILYAHPFLQFFFFFNVLPQHCTHMLMICLNILHKW